VAGKNPSADQSIQGGRHPTLNGKDSLMLRRVPLPLVLDKEVGTTSSSSYYTR
jgi:hypothetical protein